MAFAVSLDIREAAIRLSPARRPTLNMRKRELAAERFNVLSQCSNFSWCSRETLSNVHDKGVTCVGGVLLFLVLQCLFLRWRKYKRAHPVILRYSSHATAAYNKVAGRVWKFYKKRKCSFKQKCFRAMLWCIVYYYLVCGKAQRTWYKCKYKVMKLATPIIDRGKHNVYLNMTIRLCHYVPILEVSAVVIFMYLFLSGDIELNPGPKYGKLYIYYKVVSNS